MCTAGTGPGVGPLIGQSEGSLAPLGKEGCDARLDRSGNGCIPLGPGDRPEKCRLEGNPTAAVCAVLNVHNNRSRDGILQFAVQKLLNLLPDFLTIA